MAKLAKARVLIRKTSGNQVYYQANSSFLLFEELASILRKTSGLTDHLANALAPFTKKVKAAFIFGSVASGTENSWSDIDILIIGEISFAEAVKVLHPIQATMQREINPKIYSLTEWKKSINNKNSFTKEILNKPKIFIIGTIDDIR